MTSYKFAFSVSALHQTSYIGIDTGQLIKYNLSAATGVGRWHRLEQITMEAPIDNVLLNTDGSLLIVILADNGVFIIQTATMSVLSRAQVVTL